MANNNRPQSNSESLKKSHSVWSNTKLTSICVLATFAVSLLWISISSLGVEKIPSLYSYIGLGVGGVITLFCLVLLSKFKR